MTIIYNFPNGQLKHAGIIFHLLKRSMGLLFWSCMMLFLLFIPSKCHVVLDERIHQLLQGYIFGISGF
jgi:hypothetical protein